MTEAEWLACRDLKKMIRKVDPHRFDRKLRLFAVACCRRVGHLLRDDEAKHFLGLVEEVADGADGPESLRQLSDEITIYTFAERAVTNAAALDCASWQAAADSYRRAAQDAEAAAGYAVEGTAGREEYETRGRERAVQFDILRDIFGNPFRPVALAPSWLTSTVLALAEGIYAERAFDRLPILADALMDAGCDNDDVLNHCRSSGPHVRGCWVVDLLTGRA